MLALNKTVLIGNLRSLRNMYSDLTKIVLAVHKTVLVGNLRSLWNKCIPT